MCEACHDESERPLLVPVVTDRSHHATPLHFTLHCTAASAAAAGLCGSECGACGLARTCSLTTPRPRSPRHRFLWIGELEVSAANLQGGGERAVRLLSGLCVPFRLLLFCVVHASHCPVPFEGPSKLCQLAFHESRDVGSIWDCPGHLRHASRRLHRLGEYPKPKRLGLRPPRAPGPKRAQPRYAA